MSTTLLPDGVRQHHMADGQIFRESGPKFRMEYQSAVPDETYVREIAIFGLADSPHLFEAWCYVYNALRTYAFSKVVSMEIMATGEKITGDELRERMGGS